MDVKIKIFESVLSLTILIAVIYLFKVKNFFREDDGRLFSKLLIEIVLPVVIFLQLVTNKIESEQLIMILIMFVSGIAAIIISYLTAKLIKLDRHRTGAFILTSSFGSSALLGYPLIQMTFPNNPEAMTDAVLISELGVGLPIFTIAPLIAMWFSSERKTDSGFFKIVLTLL